MIVLCTGMFRSGSTWSFNIVKSLIHENNPNDTIFAEFNISIKKVINERPAELVTVEILRRYKNNIEKIQNGESSQKIQIKEITYMLDLLRAFFIINYKREITDQKNKGLYRIFIKEKIVKIFEEY